MSKEVAETGAPEPAAGETEAGAPRRPSLPNFVSFVMAVALVWLGGQFIRQGASDNLLSDNPELAMLWQGDSSDAVAQLARMRLQTRDPSGAARLAAKALQLEPLNAPALTTYGLAEEALHQTALANRAMTLAGRQGWRDLPTQVWLFRRDLLAFDFSDALDHADALLRRVNDPPPPVLNVLAAVGRDPRAQPLLADHLAANPSWRERFFVFAIALARPPAVDVAGRLLTRLAASPAKPTDEEVGMYLAALAEQRRYQEAEAAWRALTPGATQGFVHNGDFALPARTTPFDWWLTSGIGWTASLAASPDPSHGQALRIDYDGVSKPLPLRQLIVLAPGAYRLSGQMLDTGGAGAPGFAWRLVCPGIDDPLARAPAPQGLGGAWQSFSADFTVPTTGCPAQLLDLVVERSDVPKDITVWFDNLAIAPTGGVAPKTQAPGVDGADIGSKP